MQDPVWDSMSDESKDLIAKLLEVEPEKRIIASQVLEHPWMQDKDKTVHRRELGTISRMRTTMKMRRGMPSPEALGSTQEAVSAMDAKE